MRLPLLTAAAAFAVVATTLTTTPANAADATNQSWVSGVGDDANPCDRTSPCKTFAGAISKTFPGGSINVVDPGGFGAVTITKSITIDGTGTLSSVLASANTTGILVNAGVNDDVVLRNLDLIGTGCNGGTAVRVIGGRSLTLDHVRIGGFKTAVSFAGGSGTSTTTPFRLLAAHVDITSSCTAGLDLSPVADHPVQAVLTDSSITTTGTAVKAATGATVSMSRTSINGNQVGVDTSAGGVVHAGCDTTITANVSNGSALDTLCATGGTASATSGGPTAPTTVTNGQAAIRTWVSGVGDDAAPCSRTAPCRTVAGAVPKTSSAGYVDALDPVSAGPFTLTKAFTVDGSGTYLGVRATSGSGIVINAGPNDDVVLRHLELDGVGCAGATGIRILGGRSLTLDDVHIGGFKTAISYEGTGTAPYALTASSLGITGACDTGIDLSAGAAHPVQVALTDSLVSTSGTAVDAGPGAEVWTTRTMLALDTVGIALNGGTVHAGCGSELVANTTDGDFTDNLCPTVVPQGTIANMVKPAISGEVAVGQTLTASSGDWDLHEAAMAYRWYVGGAPTADTGTTYVVGVSDIGKTISVQVTASADGYGDATVESDPTAAVPLQTITHVGVPTITGGPLQVGTTLTAGGPTWTPGDVTPSYQWSADGVAIAGATGSIYTLTAGDAGKQMTVTVTAAKVGYAPDVTMSSATAPVAPASIAPTGTTTSTSTSYCVVPGLRNLRASAAVRAATSAGCTVRTKRRHAPRKKHGKVLAQSIPAGVSVKRGTQVVITVGR